MFRRQRLGMFSVLGLVALALLVSLVPLSGVIAVAVFIVVLALVGVIFFRFSPRGDAWEEAAKLGMNPWLYVVVVLVLGIAFFLFRVALRDAL